MSIPYTRWEDLGTGIGTGSHVSFVNGNAVDSGRELEDVEGAVKEFCSL